MLIIICILIGIIIFYKVVIPYIHNQYQPAIEKRITKGILSMSFWQILFSSLVCAYAFGLEPVYKQTDEDISSFLQEYSEVGDLINEYTGINGYSNFNYLMGECHSLHTYAIVFIVVAVIIALVIAIGSIGKKLNRRIVEGLAILNTLACCWIAKSSTDLYEVIIRDGATLQTIAWIGRLLGTDIYAAMDMMIRSIWILPIILIIKHFYYHKTLNEYYRIDANIKNDTESINRSSDVYTSEEILPSSSTNADAINDSMPDNSPNIPVSQADENEINVTDSKQPIEETKEEITQPDVQPERIGSEPTQAPLPYEYEDDESTRYKRWLIIGGIVLVGFIIYSYWPYKQDTNPASSEQEQVQEEYKSEPELFEERSEAIISQLSNEYGNQVNVIYKYPELSNYCAFSLTENETKYLLIYDLEREELKRFDTENLKIINDSEIYLLYFDLSMNRNNDRILIHGNNGANSIGYTEYILEINPATWKIREICWGSEIKENENGFVAFRSVMTKWNTCNADSEYAGIYVYYDQNGNLLPAPGKGDAFSLTGTIDNKYAVTMSISIQTNGIYGTYYYNNKGSNNKLYLYGGVSASKDIVLLEFNNAGQQTGLFKGRLTSYSLEGTFLNNAGIEMPFELRPVVSSSPNSNNAQSSGNASTYIPDRDAEFPGGMAGLGQYITENLQYPVNAKEKGISGDVRVSYVIDKDGSITDVKVIESVDPDLDKEAVRLISSMPKWKPGIRQSKIVKMRTSTVIRFEL